MKNMTKYSGIATLLALLVTSLAYFAPQAQAQPDYVCLPTCQWNDGRFFSIAGTNLSTLVDNTIHLQIAAMSTATTLEIGIFDGDTGGLFDLGTYPPLMFNLYADPRAEGSTTTLVKSWQIGPEGNNQWISEIINLTPVAQWDAGKPYFFHLVVSPAVPDVSSYISNFKARTDGYMFTIRPSTFSFSAPLYSMNDYNVINANYDGNWTFRLYVPYSTNTFDLWDGDLDFGDVAKTCVDTNDADTPDQKPDWAGLGMATEGVAVGEQGSTGEPPDDYYFYLFVREPCVKYSLILPDGRVFVNDNPSGNSEWEQFRITSDSNLPADYYVPELLPSGTYIVNIVGMDLANLSAWRFFYSALPDCENPPCDGIIYPFQVGDTVFSDTNGNGIQDSGEGGIAGVLVRLLDSNGLPVSDVHGNPMTAITGVDGKYLFEVWSGTYSVRIDSSNFNPGMPLAGKTSTTGGETQTNTVVDQDVLTYDFGYWIPGQPPGTGTIGFWMNHPKAWPVTTIIIGGKIYTREQAIQIMKKPVKGDMTYAMFAQLVAAKLNVLVGNESSCIDADIQAADAWMAKYPLGSKVKASSTAWKAISATYTRLDQYNNGLLCAPHRDS